MDTAPKNIRGCRPLWALPSRGSAVFWRNLTWLYFLAQGSAVWSQGILVPPPDDYQRPADYQASAVFQKGGIPPEIHPASQPAGPVQLGPLDVHPHFLYQYIYGDGIPSSPTNRVKTSINEISPGFLVYLGNHWSLDYTPTIQLYSSPLLPNTTDESVLLKGHASYQDWTFKLSQSYRYSDQVLLQTETPTVQEVFATSFTAIRQLGSHLSAQVDLAQNFTISSAANLSQDWKDWTISPSMNYQFTSQFGVGLYATAGYDLISPGSSDSFEQLGGRVNWQPGKKLSFSASAGLEVRQLMTQQLINPIFSASLTYQPWQQTAASVSASRSVTPSLFQDEQTVVTSLSATLRQRFLQKFTLEGSVGYTTSPFVGFAVFTDANVPDFNGIPITTVSRVSRVDHYRYARISLSFAFLKRGSASVFYDASDTTSGVSILASSSTQVGVQLGYRF